MGGKKVPESRKTKGNTVALKFKQLGKRVWFHEALAFASSCHCEQSSQEHLGQEE